MKATVVNGERAAHDAAASGRESTRSRGSIAQALLDVYRCMVRSRKLDDKEIQLKNQSRAFFQISGAGHEAVLVAAGLTLRPGYDWFHAYYRDRALCLQLGVTPLEMLLASVGAEPTQQRRTPDAVALGAQGAEHRPRIERHDDPGAACGRRRGGRGDLRPRRRHRRSRSSVHGDEIIYTSLGEGSTSEGEFWEALNAACTRRLPVLYSRRRQRLRDLRAGRSRRRRAATSRGSCARFPVSTSIRSTAPTSSPACARCARRPPTCARARVRPSCTRASFGPYSHSLSDDEKLYKTPAEREAEARRDPITRFAEFLRGNGLATAADLAAITPKSSGRLTTPRSEALQRAAAAEEHAPRCGSIRRTSIRRRPRSRRAAGPKASPTRWSRPSIGRSRTKWRATRASSSSARMSPMRAGKEALKQCPGQRRRLQGHARPAAAVRRRPRVQRADCRGEHHRPRRRHGDARTEAGRRDSVLRLHLAGDDAAPQRDGDVAVPVGESFLLPDGGARADRRLSARRRAVSQPVGREHLRALPGHPHRVSLERGRRGRAPAHRDPLRRSGALPRAQASLPADVQQGRVSRAETS